MTSTTQVDENFRHIFKDIVQGYSQISYKNSVAYLKHLSVFDQVDVEEIKKKYFEDAKRRGLPTEKDAIGRLRDELMWGDKEESELKQQYAYLKQVEKTKKDLYLKNEIDRVNKDIEESKKKIFALESQKESLMGHTCEKYSSGRVSDYYILKSLYKDPELSQTFYNEVTVDEMNREEMHQTVKLYNESYSIFHDLNIQKVVLQDFYQPYLPFCENVLNMFNKPLFQLSMNQVKLVIYSRMFKNIFENYSKIPDHIRVDPEKIIDYVQAQEKAKDTLKHFDKDGASTIVGASKEDYEYLGVQPEQGKSLSAKLKEKGGKMNMKDLMSVLKG